MWRSFALIGRGSSEITLWKKKKHHEHFIRPPVTTVHGRPNNGEVWLVPFDKKKIIQEVEEWLLYINVHFHILRFSWTQLHVFDNCPVNTNQMNAWLFSKPVSLTFMLQLFCIWKKWMRYNATGFTRNTALWVRIYSTPYSCSYLHQVFTDECGWRRSCKK